MSQSIHDNMLRKLHEAFGELLPQELDDIIRLNRGDLRVELASPRDTLTLQMPLIICNLKGKIECGFIYKRINPVFNKCSYYLIGRRVGSPLSSAAHTAPVIGYDPKNQVALTANGSHYLINELIAPDPFLLVNLCGFLHQEGIGNFFGESGYS